MSPYIKIEELKEFGTTWRGEGHIKNDFHEARWLTIPIG